MLPSFLLDDQQILGSWRFKSNDQHQLHRTPDAANRNELWKSTIELQLW